MVKYLKSGEDFGSKHFADSGFGFSRSSESAAHSQPKSMAKGGRAGKADKVVRSNPATQANTTAKAALGAFLLGQVHGAKQAAKRRAPPSQPPQQADPSAMGAPPPAPMGTLGGAMAAGPPGGAMAGGAPGGMRKGGRVQKYAKGGAVKKNADAAATPKASKGSGDNAKTDVRSPTSTSTKTSTVANPHRNITVTGGAGAGATTVHIGKESAPTGGKSGGKD